MGGTPAKKNLDKCKTGPYPTPSMSSSLSPDRLNKGLQMSILGPKGGIPIHGREEEGCEEGSEEEEVSVPGMKGGVDRSPSPLFHVS